MASPGGVFAIPAITIWIRIERMGRRVTDNRESRRANVGYATSEKLSPIEG
jgi:hypothetical protein